MAPDAGSAPSGSRVDAWYDQSGLASETGAAPGTYLRDPGGLLLSVNRAPTRTSPGQNHGCWVNSIV